MELNLRRRTQPDTDVVSPLRWNSTSDAGHNRTLTSYRFLQPTSTDELRPTHSEVLDSGYDTLAAVLDAPEMDETPEVTSYVECGQVEVWTRQRTPILPGIGASQRRFDNVDVRTKELRSQRRFPRMGLRRTSPLQPFAETTTSRRDDFDDCRPRLTGYCALPWSDTTTDVGTTAV